jgi:hypothetical protein
LSLVFIGPYTYLDTDRHEVSIGDDNEKIVCNDCFIECGCSKLKNIIPSRYSEVILSMHAKACLYCEIANKEAKGLNHYYMDVALVNSYGLADSYSRKT